ELAAATNFSFLRGASKAQDMVLTALLQGYAGLGIADRNTLAGVVRAWAALEQLREDGLPLPEKVREGGSPGEHAWIEHPEAQRILACQEEVKARAKAFKLAVGARLVFSDGAPEILAYPENKSGWGKLCRLLTLGNRRIPPGKKRAEKGECLITLSDLLGCKDDLLLIVMPGGQLEGLSGFLERLAQAAPGAVWLGAPMHRRGADARRLA